MDLIFSCPFRSLAMVFVAVPIGVIAGVYAAEFGAALRHHGWRAKRH